MLDFILKKLINKYGAVYLIDKIVVYQKESDPRELFNTLINKKITELELLSDHYKQQKLDPKLLMEYMVSMMLPGYHIQRSKHGDGKIDRDAHSDYVFGTFFPTSGENK